MLNSLFVTRGQDSGKSYVLTDRTITIGRDHENSILLQDDEVSRVHCSIFVESSRIFLVDEGSSNGTFLNGNAITRAEVHKGDEIRVGKTQFEFNSFLQISIDQDDASPLTASPTRVNNNSLELSKFVDQAQKDTDSISLKLDLDEDSISLKDLVANSENQEAGQQFVQIKNDLKFVYQASLATSRTLDIHRMFRELMELIFDWIPADRGCVFLVDQQTDQLETTYVKKRQIVDGDPSSRSTIQVDSAIIEYVAEHKVAVLSPGAEPAQDKQIDTQQTRPPVDEVMCVPLQGHGKLLGVLYIDTLSRSAAKSNLWFNRDSLRMMLAMAQQAAVAIENASFLESQIEKERDFALGQVTAFLDHRINNILQGINGGSHLMEAGLMSENLELCKKGWEITNNNQKRIATLVGDLMALSSPLTLAEELCDLAELVAQAAVSMKGTLNLAGLKCQLPSIGEGTIVLDRASIKTCLDYLFRMVIESAGAPGSLLEFSILKDKAMLNLNVRHPGPPIRSNAMAAADRKEDACCIAFAVVQKIVKAHNGKITIGSDCSTGKPATERKSKVTISLPLKTNP